MLVSDRLPATLDIIHREGESLALHVWRPVEPRAVLFYVHGTQSHAGWLFETAPELCARGIVVHALDRRGAGQSSGARGDIPSYATWLDDYAAVLLDIRARHARLPLTIVGQSLGGPIAAAVAARHPEAHDAILFSAPALDNLHASRSPEWLQDMRANAGPTLHDIKTPLEAFSQCERYLQWMRDDPLRLRQVSVRFIASWIALEAHLRELPAGSLQRPGALIQPRADRVVHAVAARALFDRLSDQNGVVVQLPTDDHYLELSTSRLAWLELVAGFVQTAGFRRLATEPVLQ